jgi:hypothetical protein
MIRASDGGWIDDDTLGRNDVGADRDVFRDRNAHDVPYKRLSKRRQSFVAHAYRKIECRARPSFQFQMNNLLAYTKPIRALVRTNIAIRIGFADGSCEMGRAQLMFQSCIGEIILGLPPSANHLLTPDGEAEVRQTSANLFFAFAHQPILRFSGRKRVAGRRGTDNF